jgi:molecular chaperone DnaJ
VNDEAMRVPHHYALLGVAPDASDEEIRRVWKAEAQRWHPDVSPQGGPRFIALKEAIDAIGEAGARKRYDAQLQAGVEAAVQRMVSGAEGGPSGRAVSQGVRARLGGWIDRVAGVREARPVSGRNRRLRVAVGFAEAALGTERRVELMSEKACQTCEGQGFPVVGRPWVCGRCGGIGEVLARPFLRAEWQACVECAGLGWVPEPACEPCAGRGVVTVPVTWVVPIPAGLASGTTLRVAGAGEPGVGGGAAGDLLVEVEIEADPHLRRDDARGSKASLEVRCEWRVPFWKAMAGGTMTVPTVRGPVAIALPAGLVDGEVLRLPGYGVRAGTSGAVGDQLVTVRIEWPVGLDAAALAGLRAWGEGLAPERFPRSMGQAEGLAPRDGSRTAGVSRVGPDRNDGNSDSGRGSSEGDL